ncbi:MAG: hypothetical protein R6U38_14325 [Desulfatiglandaceae bacterium]
MMREKTFFQEDAMAGGDQFGRQWKIIQTLISSRQGKSAGLRPFSMGQHQDHPI